ncbi:hypothetical protein [Vibrio crassostreae]|uniref:hypothetical protein n=2 Tax=Vibrio crassostreae TaxID=246167 RepID=UPI001053C2B7|nr:hypothetical protein [Vibrio crassostreae]MDH5950390.1 hypothetical protein [Vibrio crassostreae]
MITTVVWVCTLICALLVGAIIAGITTFINLGIDTSDPAFGNWAMWFGSLFAATAAAGAFANIHYMQKENNRLKDKDIIENKKQKVIVAIEQHKESCQTYNVLREYLSSYLSVLSQELIQHVSILKIPSLDELDHSWTQELKITARPSNQFEFKGLISDYVSKLDLLDKCYLVEYMNFTNLVPRSLPLVSEVESTKQHDYLMNVIHVSPTEKLARTKVVTSIHSLKTSFISRERLKVLIDAVEIIRQTGSQVSIQMNKRRHGKLDSQDALEEALSEVPDVLIINFLIARYSYLEYMGFETYLLFDAITDIEKLSFNHLSKKGRSLREKLAILDPFFEPYSDEMQLFPIFGYYVPELPEFTRINFNYNVTFKDLEG